MEAPCPIIWHGTREGVRDAVAAAMREGGSTTVVSLRLPLLADISVAENIALPRQYHLGANSTLALLLARDYLARLLPDDYAGKFPEALTLAEQFAVLWLRAISVPNRAVVIEAPLTSFNLDETTLQGYVARCHGLFRQVQAHDFKKVIKNSQPAGKVLTGEISC